MHGHSRFALKTMTVVLKMMKFAFKMMKIFDLKSLHRREGSFRTRSLQRAESERSFGAIFTPKMSDFILSMRDFILSMRDFLLNNE